MMLGPIARAIAITSVALAVLFCVMTVRAVVEARAESARSRVALAANDLDLAIVRLRTTARWWAPLNVYALDALAELERLGRELEARGDRARALAAYRAIHASIHAVRSFYTPEHERLERADERIASLMASEPPVPIESGRSTEQRRSEYLALLSADGPNIGGVLLALLGFAAWVSSAVVFLLWGVDSEGRILRPLGRRSALCLLLGWMAFAVGLRIA